MSPARRSTHRAADTRAPRRPVSRAVATSSWDAKLRPNLEPRVVPDRRRKGTLLLPTPLLVGQMIAAIPCGQVATVGQLREALARRFGADATCPLMTGIFVAILAGAVSEDIGRDEPPRWPIWRLVRDDGTLHERWPLAARYRAVRLREEGVRITRHNGHWAAILTQHC